VARVLYVVRALTEIDAERLAAEDSFPPTLTNP